MSDIELIDRQRLRMFVGERLDESDFRTFMTWEDAGLLLESLAEQKLKPHLLRAMHGQWMCKINDEYAGRCVASASDTLGPVAVARAVLRMHRN